MILKARQIREGVYNFSRVRFVKSGQIYVVWRHQDGIKVVRINVESKSVMPDETCSIVCEFSFHTLL